MQKIPFETIQKCINKDDYDFPTLIWNEDLRTPEVEKIYEEHKTQIIKDGFTTSQIIRQKLFPANQKTFILEKAKFPYGLIDIRFHYILWVNSKDKETIKKAIKFEKLSFAGENYIYFQNEPKNQSVPELTHFHFLIK